MFKFYGNDGIEDASWEFTSISRKFNCEDRSNDICSKSTRADLIKVIGFTLIQYSRIQNFGANFQNACQIRYTKRFRCSKLKILYLQNDVVWLFRAYY